MLRFSLNIINATILLIPALILLTSFLTTLSCTPVDEERDITEPDNQITPLPEPALTSDYSVEEALKNRRSIRRYTDEPVDLPTVSQILWAAQGITHEQRGYRTSPSAGATFPLEIYLVAGNVDDLPQGLYRYDPQEHHLISMAEGDLRSDLSAAALGQTPVRDGAFVVIIAADYDRTTGRYGERGIRYVHMEVGHVGQNIHLQAESLGLGTVVIGAFNDSDVKRILHLPADIEPLYLMPLGKK